MQIDVTYLEKLVGKEYLTIIPADFYVYSFNALVHQVLPSAVVQQGSILEKCRAWSKVIKNAALKEGKNELYALYESHHACF